MSQCSAVTKRGERCRVRCLPTSRYCIFHQDPLPWLLTIFGVAATVAVAMYQEKEPKLVVSCGLVESSDPTRVKCGVMNSGRAEARDVHVSFTNMLPVGTQVVGPPEVALSLRPVDSPPDPAVDPQTATLTTAFVIHIPRVTPRDSFEFTVLTADSDNQRAAAQLRRIHVEMKSILECFGQRLTDKAPSDAQRWQLREVWNAHLKRDSFFSPTKFSYEGGRQSVSFFTDDELLAEAVNQDLNPRY